MKYYKSIRNGKIYSEKELVRMLDNMGLNIGDVSELYKEITDDTTKLTWKAGTSAEGHMITKVSLSIKEKAIVDDFIYQLCDNPREIDEWGSGSVWIDDTPYT